MNNIRASILVFLVLLVFQCSKKENEITYDSRLLGNWKYVKYIGFMPSSNTRDSELIKGDSSYNFNFYDKNKYYWVYWFNYTGLNCIQMDTDEYWCKGESLYYNNKGIITGQKHYYSMDTLIVDWDTGFRNSKMYYVPSVNTFPPDYYPKTYCN